jgi:glycosyltransferase involved in cell wall biosynthesis
LKHVIHLIPYDAIGGVERAAQSMGGLINAGFSFSLSTIFPRDAVKVRLSLWNPLYYLGTIFQLLRARPAVLVVSLWRAYAIGIIVKIFLPRTNLVVFLHLPKHVHIIDSLLTSVAALLSTRVWADSSQTLRQRLPRLERAKCRVISFVTERLEPASIESVPQPSFVFWGRIHPQKCLTRAVIIFSGIYAKIPEAQFVIIGPDGGDLEAVKQVVQKMGLDNAVSFRGSLEFSSIRETAATSFFYLQTSEMEGMAMSVVEAMQLGLVPVVTPVGQIAQYARAGQNAIVINDDTQAINAVIQLLGDNHRYKKLRKNAIGEWSRQPLYRDDFVQACGEILFSNTSLQISTKY